MHPLDIVNCHLRPSQVVGAGVVGNGIGSLVVGSLVGDGVGSLVVGSFVGDGVGSLVVGSLVGDGVGLLAVVDVDVVEVVVSGACVVAAGVASVSSDGGDFDVVVVEVDVVVHHGVCVVVGVSSDISISN